jgi:hypothetical protein
VNPVVREQHEAWRAGFEAEVEQAQTRVCAVLRAEALLPPGYRVVYDTEPVRPLSADIAREWRAKGQDR